MAIPLHDCASPRASLTQIYTYHSDLGDPLDSRPASPARQGCDGVQVYTWRTGSQQWCQSLRSHASPTTTTTTYAERLGLLAGSQNSADVTVFVAPDTEPRPCWESCMRDLVEIFPFLSTWRKFEYQFSNGYFGYQDILDKDGKAVVGLHTWSRFLLQFFAKETAMQKWRNIIPFTSWSKESGRMRILFLGSEPEVVERLLASILDTLQKKGLPSHPLWPYESIFDQVIRCQHHAVLSIRHLILAEEEGSLAGARISPGVDYPRLFEVTKHTTTVAEILNVNMRTLEDILSCHSLVGTDDSDRNPISAASSSLLRQKFLFQSHVLFSIRDRSLSYKERIRGATQRAFNVVAQEHASNAVTIASAARADGRAMTSLAIITLIFLPPTFISAIFSTTFFSFGDDPGSWVVSEKIWIYCISVIPVTMVVAAILWRKNLRDVSNFSAV
ncbi:hypothetical protein QBC47DRAFT_382542 [Echria macrotheca]|uniref:Uncharacterized protein n=1 Tax=Echria macrotheca TaxID=438768 RepID=A0AAJ0BD26_9PEZI|nr:hypothetical protein QBC47DRAFT_382542 [Echria macrotheca]